MFQLGSVSRAGYCKKWILFSKNGFQNVKTVFLVSEIGSVVTHELMSPKSLGLPNATFKSEETQQICCLAPDEGVKFFTKWDRMLSWLIDFHLKKTEWQVFEKIQIMLCLFPKIIHRPIIHVNQWETRMVHGEIFNWKKIIYFPQEMHEYVCGNW